MFSILIFVYKFCYYVSILAFNILVVYKMTNKIRYILSGIVKRTNDYILITGCDSGFGFMAAKAFSEKKLYVFAACLTQDGADMLNKDLSFNGKAIKMDITNLEDINSTKSLIESEINGKGLWGLLNNSGICDVAPVEWMTTDDMKKMMDINLWGAINVTRAMLPLIKKAKGRVVTAGSVHGKVPCEFFSAYCMSKGALSAFSESLRYEMLPWDVGVSFIEAGFHDTGLAGKLVSSYFERIRNLPSKLIQDYGESYSMDILKAGFQTVFQYPNNPNGMINTYLHAVLSTRPKARYLVGLDANTIYLLLATLPTEISDFIKYSLTSVVPIKNK